MQKQNAIAARPAPKGAPAEGVEGEAAAGQALFEMANLRPERTGLPFVVFISQRGGARHDVRVKAARLARVGPSDMVAVALRPRVRVVRGALDRTELARLAEWVELNRDALIDYRNGDLEYTEDVIAMLKPIGAPP